MLPFHPAEKKNWNNKQMMPPYPLVVIFTANLARVLWDLMGKHKLTPIDVY